MVPTGASMAGVLLAGLAPALCETTVAAQEPPEEPPPGFEASAQLSFLEIEARVDEETEQLAVATAGVRYRWELSSTSELVEELGYVQAFEAFENWKLDQSLSLTATLTSVLSLKFSNTVRYANEPVPGFETDTVTTAALVWTLRRAARP
jgi:putative salt-induced outer membrane protein YdiY